VAVVSCSSLIYAYFKAGSIASNRGLYLPISTGLDWFVNVLVLLSLDVALKEEEILLLTLG